MEIGLIHRNDSITKKKIMTAMALLLFAATLTSK